jgi:FHA domain
MNGTAGVASGSPVVHESAGAVLPSQPPAVLCPRCGSPGLGRFCEACGAPSASLARTWTAVVSASRAYYDSVQAVGGPDVASIVFPAAVPERRFALNGARVRIGRRSVSREVTPEIDLSGPPGDPGISRLHAVLLAQPDGTWAIVDPGSENGTIVNGFEILPGEQVQLSHSDSICIGAWTQITIVVEAAAAPR